jgi:hypothetical protein
MPQTHPRRQADGKENGRRGREGRSGKGKKNDKKINGVENCGAKFSDSF